MKMNFTASRPGYAECGETLKRLAAENENISLAKAGKSAAGRRIYALVIGNGSRRILAAAGINGLEKDMGFMLVRFAAELANAAKHGKSICGYAAEKLLSENTLVLVPFANPDGIEYSALPERSTAVSSEVRFYSRRGANARGIDLNLNFAADIPDSAAKNSCGLIAAAAQSEPETAALARLCRQLQFERIINLGTGSRVALCKGRSEDEYLTARLLAAAALMPCAVNENEDFDGFCAWAADELDTFALSVRLENENAEEYKKLCRLLTYSLVL